MPLSFASWEDIHRSVAQGVPEPIGNPSVCSMHPKSFQSPQINPSSNAASTNLQEFPLLPEWNMGWGQHYIDKGANAISSCGISTFGGESSFGSFNGLHVNKDATDSSLLVCPRETAPIHTRNNDQSVLQGKFEDSLLSLGRGGTSDKLKEAHLTELNIACARQASNQTFNAGFMGSSVNNSGSFNQYSRVSRMTLTNNEFGSHGSVNSGLESNPNNLLELQQRQLRGADRLIEVPSTELKMVHARKATGQTLDADIMGFQRNNSGISDQLSNVGRMTSTNYGVGIHSTLNSGLGSSRQSILQMQLNDSRNVKSGYTDRYKGKQYVHSATLGGNSAHLFNPQQRNLKPPEFVKPSWMTSNHTPSEQLQDFHSTTANSPNYAGQVISQNATPTQVLVDNIYSQRTKTSPVSWVSSGAAGTDTPFPKRLGVESGQVSQFSDKRSIHMAHNALRPIGPSDGTPVSYPMSFQEPFLTYGHSKNALIQRPEGPQGASPTYASNVNSQSQKLDLHARPHHKRTAAAPQSTSHWVQRQKLVHPIVHHSIPKPPIPVTTAPVCPSIPVRSRTQQVFPVAARIPPVISNVKPRAPAASAPAVSHITWKDPDATSKLSGHKCLICKRDLVLTSEGVVYQPTVPPPVAVLPCGHTFHDQCLQNITPEDQAKDPPCIPCAIGEN